MDNIDIGDANWKFKLNTDKITNTVVVVIITIT